MSGKQTHAELVSQPHSAPVVGLRLLHIGRIAASGLSLAKMVMGLRPTLRQENQLSSPRADARTRR